MIPVSLLINYHSFPSCKYSIKFSKISDLSFLLKSFLAFHGVFSVSCLEQAGKPKRVFPHWVMPKAKANAILRSFYACWCENQNWSFLYRFHSNVAFAIAFAFKNSVCTDPYPSILSRQRHVSILPSVATLSWAYLEFVPYDIQSCENQERNTTVSTWNFNRWEPNW